MVRRNKNENLKLEWKPDFRTLARSSTERPSVVVAIGTSCYGCVRLSMVQKRKKNTRNSACDCAKVQPFIIYKPASFEEPVSETRCRYRFSLRCFRGRGCTAAGRSGCSAGKAKKSSRPWHFRCWSLRRNELECTDLVHWTGALHRFLPRGAMGLVRITSWYPNFNGSHFDLPPSEIHRMTGLPPKIAWTMTYSHRPHYRCWFCVGKALWRWFYPRSRKIDPFQTLVTGVPKLKTWLGTQRVKSRRSAFACFLQILRMIFCWKHGSQRHGLLSGKYISPLALEQCSKTTGAVATISGYGTYCYGSRLLPQIARVLELYSGIRQKCDFLNNFSASTDWFW